MKEDPVYTAKAFVEIAGVYKEVVLRLTKEERDLLEKSGKASYSMGAIVAKPVDVTVEDYQQT